VSLDTYANLKTEIADWLNKSNLTTRIDSFIDLAEAQINRDLRTQDMEAIASASVSSNPVDLTASPFTRYRKMRSVSIVVGGGDVVLNYLSPDLYKARYSATASGVPEYYTIIGSSLYLDPAPDQAYTYTAYYYQSLNPLSGTNTSNWVLANHPDLYLYGSLSAARMFLKKQDVEGYEMAYRMALAAVKREDIRDRQGGTSRMITEAGVV